MALVLGIDGGGTSCRGALATASGAILGRGAGGPANIRTDLAGARASIIASAEAAFGDAGEDPSRLSEVVAVLGLAGSNVGTYASQLGSILPFRRHRVVSDALIALQGAVGGGDGAIAVLGTGTAYLARRNGVERAIGGWGFLLGDQGSGARIGRDLLEATLLAHDGVVAGSPLTDDMLAQFGGDPREIVEFTTTARPGDFGGFARRIFEHAERGDAVAERILGRAVASIEASLAALDLQQDMPLCLLGGLAPRLGPRLSGRFQALLRQPKGDALTGAVALAVKEHAGGE